MKKKIYLFALIALISISCKNNAKKEQSEKDKIEITEQELKEVEDTTENYEYHIK